MNSTSDFLVLGGYLLTVDFDGEAWKTGVPGITSSLADSKNGTVVFLFSIH
jgi:hypothetical protein